jgi:hypothetical protein
METVSAASLHEMRPRASYPLETPRQWGPGMATSIGAGPPPPSRLLPLALKMSSCLALPEIASAVVQNLSSRSDKATLYALTATNRALCEASLDVLWEEPKVWHLAQLMNSSIWYLETGFEEVESWDDHGYTAHTISREYSVSPHMRPLRRARDSSRG